MENTKVSNNKNIINLLMFSAILIFGMGLYKSKIKINFNTETLNNFSIIFLSMILEAIPFIIVGAFISSLIQIFISEDVIYRIIPKNIFWGTIAASIAGLFFPVCECAIVPICRSLIKKGVPISIATTFMLSVPIVNPIVLLSTYYAFLGNTYMIFIRAFMGIFVSILVGVIIGVLYEKNPIKDWNMVHNSECNCVNCNVSRYSSRSRLSEIVHGTSYELYNIGRFFIIGALLSSIMQTFVPKEKILAIGQGDLRSILVMMSLAFILSICSETDAFIARTFLGQFTIGSVIGFLVFGPMLDIKNTIMLFGNFKKRYAITLILLVVSMCFILSVICNIVSFMLIN
ncbi:permease [Clostridium sp. DJ247]|uniref:permease n=1 Tax=Clostridium sp. DJ247 TaxID=2726188 RepID=UPI00162354F0|nr:permease [Clostridium sp. DJ247]MBC2582190.1 permease [Clostridium sp. DJ247]